MAVVLDSIILAKKNSKKDDSSIQPDKKIVFEGGQEVFWPDKDSAWMRNNIPGLD